MERLREMASEFVDVAECVSCIIGTVLMGIAVTLKASLAVYVLLRLCWAVVMPS